MRQRKLTTYLTAFRSTRKVAAPYMARNCAFGTSLPCEKVIHHAAQIIVKLL